MRGTHTHIKRILFITFLTRFHTNVESMSESTSVFSKIWHIKVQMLGFLTPAVFRKHKKYSLSYVLHTQVYLFIFSKLFFPCWSILFYTNSVLRFDNTCLVRALSKYNGEIFYQFFISVLSISTFLITTT
jgi:hypothetical protein